MHKHVDVLVLGGGFSGLHAARLCARKCKTALISRTKAGSGASAVSMSVHRFAPQDDELRARHARTILDSGQGLADAALVDLLVRDGATRVLDMRSLRADLSLKTVTEPDTATGQDRDYPYFLAAPERKGIGLTRPLRAAAILDGCELLDNWAVLDLRQQGGLWHVFAEQGNHVRELTARAVILATGGAVGLYAHHSGTADLCGSGMALALRLGLPLRDMECVQFYPYRIFSPTICDIFPDVFNYGACLRTLDGERFMRDFPKMELENRDVLSREIDKYGEVLLDLTACDLERLRMDSPPLYRLHRRCPTGPLRVRIKAHHTMGGVCINEHTQTTLPGLFACGEVCGGIHGANRLAGHALTETAVFGYQAAQSALEWLTQCPTPCSSGRPETTDCALPDLGSDDPTPLAHALREVMWTGVGICRHADGLRLAITRIDEIEQVWAAQRPKNLRAWASLRDMLLTGRAVAACALLRKESRGAHYRADFPATNPDCARSIIYTVAQGAEFSHL